ncbi:hypothetical protein H5410_048651, partial [Solanum commersonii]
SFQTSTAAAHNHTASKFTENTANTRRESKLRTQYYFLVVFVAPSTILVVESSPARLVPFTAQKKVTFPP